MFQSSILIPHCINNAACSHSVYTFLTRVRKTIHSLAFSLCYTNLESLSSSISFAASPHLLLLHVCQSVFHSFTVHSRPLHSVYHISLAKRSSIQSGSHTLELFPQTFSTIPHVNLFWPHIITRSFHSYSYRLNPISPLCFHTYIFIYLLSKPFVILYSESLSAYQDLYHTHSLHQAFFVVPLHICSLSQYY